MNRFLYTIIFVCSILQLFGQEGKITRGGQISFISSQNIYVKFATTENIQKGDTLFITKENKLIPALIVDQFSSISCICKPIGQIHLKVSDEITALINKNKTVPSKATPVLTDTTSVKLGIVPLVSVPQKTVARKEQLVQGRLSLSSYSNLSNVSAADNTRFRYTLILNIANQTKSTFAAESYVTYTHSTNVTSANSIFNGMRIYNLAIKYNLNDKISFWLGRKINPKVSNLGAVDGLQMEVNTGNFFFGAMGGSRPDYFDYSFNFNLIEYGAYLGHHSSSTTGTMQSSTLAFFEQNNSGKTDRRFAYFQHDNSLLKNVNLFVSGEVDLYKVENGQPMNSLTLTSFYLSLQYKLNRQLSFFGSYDERKNVIYYETFKSYVDQLLETATRQGIQFRINYRPGQLVMVSVRAGHQFRNNDVRATDNISGYLTFNKVPLILGPATFSLNILKTGYVDGKIAGLKINKDLVPGKLYSGLGYQFVDYQFISTASKLQQHIVDLDLSWQFNRKLSFSVYCEKTFEEPVNYLRIYANLIKRF